MLQIYSLLPVPEEFQYDPMSNSYGDPTRRPEVKNATIEFIAPQEYMVYIGKGLEFQNDQNYIYSLYFSFEHHNLLYTCIYLMSVMQPLKQATWNFSAMFFWMSLTKFQGTAEHKLVSSPTTAAFTFTI